ncbi:MAG: hypothetical protein REH83_05000 [Rickettsiella sp.]|nr:hypothetical protein [Rickettsiella sp.]
MKLNQSQEKALAEITERIPLEDKDQELLSVLVEKIKEKCTSISYHNNISKVATSIPKTVKNNPKTTGLATKVVAAGTAPLTAGAIGGTSGSLIGKIINESITQGTNAAVDPIRKVPLAGDPIADGLGSVFGEVANIFDGIGGFIAAIVITILASKISYKFNKWSIKMLGKMIDKLLNSAFDVKDVDKELLDLLQQEAIIHFFCKSIIFINQNNPLVNKSLFKKIFPFKKMALFSEETKILKATKSEIYRSNQATANDCTTLSKYLESALPLNPVDKIELSDKLKPVLEILQKIGDKGTSNKKSDTIHPVHALGKAICTPRSAVQNSIVLATGNSQSQTVHKTPLSYKPAPNDSFVPATTSRQTPSSSEEQTRRNSNVSNLTQRFEQESHQSRVNNPHRFHRPAPKPPLNRQTQAKDASENTFRKR